MSGNRGKSLKAAEQALDPIFRVMKSGIEGMVGKEVQMDTDKRTYTGLFLGSDEAGGYYIGTKNGVQILGEPSEWIVTRVDELKVCGMSVKVIENKVS